MIIVDLTALMFFWDIQLNALSLVNIVMVNTLEYLFHIFFRSFCNYAINLQAIGISVEFCCHIIYYYNKSEKITRKTKAADSLNNIGSSVST